MPVKGFDQRRVQLPKICPAGQKTVHQQFLVIEALALIHFLQGGQQQVCPAELIEGVHSVGKGVQGLAV